MPIPIGGAPGASGPAPEISVIVPTAGRPEAITRLLRGLAAQTLGPERFEVIVTDDGTQPPVAPALEQLRLPFRLDVRWQPRRGPAAARNRAIERARAPILLILNDDAGPPPDLLGRHLAAQRSSREPRAWLGGFDFAPECRSPFAVALTRLGALFPFHLMQRDRPNPGRFFWTCNLSVPTQAVRDAGGFDESFTRPVCEDVELGWRLERRGVAVWWLADAACLHHHPISVHWFMKRQVELGLWIVRLWRKHRDDELLPWLRAAGGDPERLARSIEHHARARATQAAAAARQIDELDRHGLALPASDPRREATIAAIAARIDAANTFSTWLGLLAGLRGWSAGEVRQRLAERERASA
jgi:GT2 family glycosyltransferase